MALFRYVCLKSLRDGSLTIFVAGPAMMALAALGGVTIAKSGLHYPFFMDPLYTPAQNAALAGEIVMIPAITFASMAAFWTLRSEIATRSIGVLVLAARPLMIAVVLVLFAAAMGIVGTLLGTGTVMALTAASPPHLAAKAVTAVMASLASAAIGALAVMISAEPAMIIGSYCASILLFVWMLSTGGSLPVMVLIAVAMFCTVLSAFLLERRCSR